MIIELLTMKKINLRNNKVTTTLKYNNGMCKRIKTQNPPKNSVCGPRVFEPCDDHVKACERIKNDTIFPICLKLMEADSVEGSLLLMLFF